MSSLLRRLVLPPIAAASLFVAAAGTALAGTPDATVSVFNGDGTPAGATVCDFYLQFNPVAGGETGSWQLRDSSNAVVESGDYAVTATDADREPDSGVFSLANGTYQLRWDDETPIDSSRMELTIVVQCAAATSTPEITLAPATDTPAPATDTPAPSFGQSQGAETDVPGPTQPNTSAVDDSRPDSGSWIGFLSALAGALALIVGLTPRTRRVPEDRPR